MKILITGSKGFIGSHLLKALQADGHELYGIDIKDEYGVDIKNKEAIDELFCTFRPEIVIHLAASVGVSGGQIDPSGYIANNIGGFQNILESCVTFSVKHLIYASSSSVYGNGTLPFNLQNTTDSPKSVYAATKKSNELMAHAFSKGFGLKTTGLRLFTVYGKGQRTDMSIHKFIEAIRVGQPIILKNKGCITRSYTYIDDVIGAIKRVIEMDVDNSLYKVFNIAGKTSYNLEEVVKTIGRLMGKKPKILLDIDFDEYDMPHTETSTSLILYQTSLEAGLRSTIDWHLKHSIPF